MDFKTRLKQARKKAKITQEQLAEACGCSKGAVSQWENGLTVPELGTFITICETLKASADFLLFGISVPDVTEESITLANKITSMSPESRAHLSDLFKSPASDDRVFQSYKNPSKRHA